MRLKIFILFLVVLSYSALADYPMGSVFKDCDVCPEMVVVPPGEFIMGSTNEEVTRAGVRQQDWLREQPSRKVVISKPFAMGRFEIKVSEWRAFLNEVDIDTGSECLTWDISTNSWTELKNADWQNPGYDQSDNYAVGCVGLADAIVYVRWLSEKTGNIYRIPTEAEWEFSARGGQQTLQYWGDSMENICAYANVSDLDRADIHGGLAENPTRYFKCRDGFPYTAPVGSYLPNQFGLYDMVGNIWEWVEDCYAPGYAGAPKDGSSRKVDACESAGIGMNHFLAEPPQLDSEIPLEMRPRSDRRYVVRSGGWYARNWFNRPTGRSREFYYFRSSTLGVRVLRELD